MQADRDFRSRGTLLALVLCASVSQQSPAQDLVLDGPSMIRHGRLFPEITASKDELRFDYLEAQPDAVGQNVYVLLFRGNKEQVKSSIEYDRKTRCYVLTAFKVVRQPDFRSRLSVVVKRVVPRHWTRAGTTDTGSLSAPDVQDYEETTLVAVLHVNDRGPAGSDGIVMGDGQMMERYVEQGIEVTVRPPARDKIEAGIDILRKLGKKFSDTVTPTNLLTALVPKAKAAPLTEPHTCDQQTFRLAQDGTDLAWTFACAHGAIEGSQPAASM